MIGNQSNQTPPTISIWVWLKIKEEGQTAGFGPCFHLPGQPILEFHFFEPQPFECMECEPWKHSQVRVSFLGFGSSRT